MKDIFLWVILPLILAEALLVGPWIAERLLRWGTRWLPKEYRERYIADWLGELDAVPGSLFKLGFAARVLLSVPATLRALTGRDTLWVVIAKRLLALAVTGLLMAAMVLVRLRNQVRSNPERAEAFTSFVERALRRPAALDAQMPDPTRTYRPVLSEVTLGEVGYGVDVYEFKATAKGRAVNGADELEADRQVRQYLRFLEERQPRHPDDEQPPSS
jgi:hypothetical protein